MPIGKDTVRIKSVVSVWAVCVYAFFLVFFLLYITIIIIIVSSRKIEPSREN